MQQVNRFLVLILAILSIMTGYLVYNWWIHKTKEITEKNVNVLQDKIQKVLKLTTVEGHYTELFEKKSFKYFDISPFQKKMIVRVKATVAAGYDLDGIQLEMDSLYHTVWMNALPDPSILYIDHNLDYYDISEGLFTSFEESDYNLIQSEAKELIRQKALESNLLQNAKTQSNEIIDLIKSITTGAGWDLKIRTRPAIKN